MYKLRLNPSQPQIGLFNTSDLNNPAVENILKAKHGWEDTDYIYELLKRFKLWYYVSGQEKSSIKSKGASGI
jgi:hypothetical protein